MCLVFLLFQLLVGDFGLSENQQEMQMAVWSVMAAPLFVSADLTSLSVHARSLLTNKLALAINQDPLGIMGRQKAMVSTMVCVSYGCVCFMCTRYRLLFDAHKSVVKLFYL